MDEVTTTEVDAVEPEMETEDAVENTIDNMSDEEFNKAFDNDTSENPDDKVVDTDEDVNLDELYTTQQGNTDAKLDKPILLKYNGEVMTVDSIMDLKNLAERGFNSTQKFQKLAEDRKALEDQIKELGQTPNVPEDNSEADEVEAISNDILQSDYAEVFTAQVSTLPDEVKQALATNPRMLEGLSIDYQSGLAEAIMPQVHKLMRINGLSFEAAYSQAGKSYQNNNTDTPIEKPVTQDTPKAKMLKAEPKTGSKASNTGLGRKAIDSMNSKEFDAYFASH